MHLLHLFILATIFGVILVESLQNIYVGTTNKVNENYEQTSYIAWFIDRPVCTSATVIGQLYGSPDGVCDKPVTIQGHTNITFTGCTRATGPSLAGWPAYVYDGGNLALTCSFTSSTNPPPTQVGGTCPENEPPPNGYFSVISLVMWCK